MGADDPLRADNDRARDRDREVVTDLLSSKWGKRAVVGIVCALGVWLFVISSWTAIFH